MTTAHAIARYLTFKEKTLATAESCTGGLIAHSLTNIPGSSLWFKGGIIAYDNEVKINLLNVPRTLLLQQGAVSAKVAQQMAEHIRGTLKTDFGIAVTGIAGPTGGTPQKPVGLVFISASCLHKTLVRNFLFKGTRLSIKKQAAQAALNLVGELIA
jgi:PncC family amidohydrolase